MPAAKMMRRPSKTLASSELNAAVLDVAGMPAPRLSQVKPLYPLIASDITAKFTVCPVVQTTAKRSVVSLATRIAVAVSEVRQTSH